MSCTFMPIDGWISGYRKLHLLPKNLKPLLTSDFLPQYRKYELIFIDPLFCYEQIGSCIEFTPCGCHLRWTEDEFDQMWSSISLKTITIFNKSIISVIADCIQSFQPRGRSVRSDWTRAFCNHFNFVQSLYQFFV